MGKRGTEGDDGNNFVPCTEIFERMEDFGRMANQFNSSVLSVFFSVSSVMKKGHGQVRCLIFITKFKGKGKETHGDTGRDREGKKGQEQEKSGFLI